VPAERIDELLLAAPWRTAAGVGVAREAQPVAR
jgi:hypothetical protein